MPVATGRDQTLIGSLSSLNLGGTLEVASSLPTRRRRSLSSSVKAALEAAGVTSKPQSSRPSLAQDHPDRDRRPAREVVPPENFRVAYVVPIESLGVSPSSRTNGWLGRRLLARANSQSLVALPKVVSSPTVTRLRAGSLRSAPAPSLARFDLKDADPLLPNLDLGIVEVDGDVRSGVSHEAQPRDSPAESV